MVIVRAKAKLDANNQIIVLSSVQLSVATKASSYLPVRGRGRADVHQLHLHHPSDLKDKQLIPRDFKSTYFYAAL